MYTSTYTIPRLKETQNGVAGHHWVQQTSLGYGAQTFTRLVNEAPENRSIDMNFISSIDRNRLFAVYYRFHANTVQTYPIEFPWQQPLRGRSYHTRNVGICRSEAPTQECRWLIRFPGAVIDPFFSFKNEFFVQKLFMVPLASPPADKPYNMKTVGIGTLTREPGTLRISEVYNILERSGYLKGEFLVFGPDDLNQFLSDYYRMVFFESQKNFSDSPIYGYPVPPKLY
jgi:hypothetical protein